jgi:hypothetical protein
MADPAHKRIGEDVIALELAVPPNAGLFAEKLSQPHPQPFVKGLHPTLQPFGNWFIVDVGIADKDVVLESGYHAHLLVSKGTKLVALSALLHGSWFAEMRVG